MLFVFNYLQEYGEHRSNILQSYAERDNWLGCSIQQSCYDLQATGAYSSTLGICPLYFDLLSRDASLFEISNGRPSTLQSWLNRMNIMTLLECWTWFSSYWKHDTSFTGRLEQGYWQICILVQGNYADAIACYNEVLRVDPMAADGLVNRGNTLKEIGRVSEAIQDYIRAVNIRPTMAEAHANLASAYKDRLCRMLWPSEWTVIGKRDVCPQLVVMCLQLVLTLLGWCSVWVLWDVPFGWISEFSLLLCGDGERNSGHVEAAIKSYKQALFLRADFPEATCNLLHTLQVHIKIIGWHISLEFWGLCYWVCVGLRAERIGIEGVDCIFAHFCALLFL